MLMFINNLYRIVDKVVYGEQARVTILLNRDSVIYKAHFPGNPITPGACIVEMGREIASLVLEKDLVLEKADNIKFLAGIHPGNTPRVVFKLQVQEQEKGKWRVRAEVMDGDNIMTKMTLCLKETLFV
ncbi:MAG TPA: hypothetical protein DDW70_05640 [Rikenellaceae bacterium]|nr:hypothetical protein [Rikenellaceae bacterium]